MKNSGNCVTVDNYSPYEMKNKIKEGLFELLTVDEVAQWLRVHRTTVTRYAKSGELKSYKLPKCNKKVGC